MNTYIHIMIYIPIERERESGIYIYYIYMVIIRVSWIFRKLSGADEKGLSYFYIIYYTWRGLLEG